MQKSNSVMCLKNLRFFRFLGYVDKIGVAYEGDTIATGYGSYIALVSWISLHGATRFSLFKTSAAAHAQSIRDEADAVGSGSREDDRQLPQSPLLPRRALLEQGANSLLSALCCFTLVEVVLRCVQYELVVVTKHGATVKGPLSSQTNWDIGKTVRWAA